MNEKILQVFTKLLRALTGFGVEKEFIFTSTILDGTEQSNTIDDTDVIEYEFVNTGTTICFINGITLYPPSAGFNGFNRVRLPAYTNEMDVTIYKYRFAPVDFILAQTIINVGAGQFITPTTIKAADAVFPAETQTFNRLLVISKVKANKRTKKPS